MEGIKSFRIVQGDTLFKDEHPNEKADFILANPPFNQKDNKMIDEERWKEYGFCKENTNYGWISHIIYKLKPEGGVGAVIMVNATLFSANKDDVEMRKKWINENLVETIITLPNKLFYTTSISPSVWILRKGRKTDEVLMIDISQEDFGEKIIKRKKSDKERILTSHDIEKVTKVYQKFLKERKIANSLPARIVSQKEIEENNYTLVPAFYLEPKEVKLTQKEINRKLLSTTEELEKLIEEQDNHHKQLRKLLKELKKETDEEKIK